MGSEVYQPQSELTSSLTLAKLRWQCRRGMLELDLLLVLFLEEIYLKLAPQEQHLFHKLLEFPDPTLYLWLLNADAPEAIDNIDPDLHQLIHKIRLHSISQL